MTGEVLKENDKAARKCLQVGRLCCKLQLMNSLQVASRRKQRQRAAATGIAFSYLDRALLLLAAVAVVLFMPAGAGTIVAGVSGLLSDALTSIVFTLALSAVIYSVLRRIKVIVAGIKESVREAREKVAALGVALAADYIIVRVIANTIALASAAAAAKAHIHTRARTPDAGRILSSVRDLFARTVAHLRATTSTLRAAGIRP